MSRLTATIAAALTAAALTLSACSGGEGGEADTAADGALPVVASTDVYGSILESVGGEHVSVRSIIDRPTQDPHSYEATARDRLAVSDARLVVLNGGGYDSFMETLVAEEQVPEEDVLNAVDISGLDTGAEEHTDEQATEESGDHAGHSHGAFNEHVWYSPQAMGLLAEAAAERLAGLDPENAETFRANAAEFNDGIDSLLERLAALHPDAEGRDVAVTEPVPNYLLEDAGLHNVTPDDFTEAVEEGSDVPVAVLNEMEQLVRSGDLAFLAYNSQTASPQTETVRRAAEDAGVPVLDFSETLPEDEDYLQWMGANVESIEGVLR